jgi:PAS domain S-box-containing protein
MSWLLVTFGVAALAALLLWWRERSLRLAGPAPGQEATSAAPPGETVLEAAFRGAGAGMALLDAEGRVLEANEALRRLSGFGEQELERLDLPGLLHPDDRVAAQASLEALAGGPPDHLVSHQRCLRQDGTVLQVRCALTAVRHPDGRLRRTVAMVEDASERQALQERLAVTDRLASLGTLTAGVANEIANPLAYVSGNLAFAREALAAGAATPPEALAQARQALDEANEGAARVRQIVGDLTMLARLGGERRQPIDVPGAMRAALNVAAGLLRPRALLQIDLAPVPPVTGDPARLGQAFLDLLVNAGQAIPEGRPEANQVRVSAAIEPDGRIKVEVSDTGCGIPPEVLPHVFTPFFTTKPAGEGTGVGLARCQRIVAELGGELLVRSQVGRGTTFTILLPPAAVAVRPAVGMTPQPMPPPPVAPARAGPRARVLVVDDEPYVGRTMRRILGASHDVEVVESARAALERLGQPPAPDVILCDLMMPGMTGMELHAAVQGRDRAMAGRMVFVTGGTLHGTARGFLASVSNPVLEKPFATDLLRGVVEETLRRGVAALPPQAGQPA